jgi:hypothetical protein
MKTTLTATLAATLAAVVLLAAPGFAAAQTSAASDAKPAAKSAKKKPAANAKRGNPKTSAKKEAAGTEAAEAARTPEELAIAERVHVGKLPCELGASVTLTQDEKSAGYFDVQGKNFKYRMFPVATTTGAIRLEDQKAGAVWLQLANKSMLMNQKQGIRLADECMSPAQVAMAESMKSNPPASVLDAPKPAASKDAPAPSK